MELHFQQDLPVRPITVKPGHLDCQSTAMDKDEDAAKHGRLIYSANGLLVVHSDAGHWVVPPTTVLRLLPGVAYSVRKAEQVSVRVIELPDSLNQRLSTENSLYRLTPLLRELLEALNGVVVNHSNDSVSNDSKSVLLIDLLNEAGVWQGKTSHRCMGLPNDPRVAHICDYIVNNLDAPKTLQDWASELKNDTRTLHRLFVQEFGMPFVQWRQQTRLMAALEWLAEGRQVMEVALDLGYQTQSAFAAMFRRNMGFTPSEWQENRRPQSVRLRYAADR